MAGLQPRGEHLRKAVRWISERRAEESSIPIGKLIEEAGVRFDLSPKDEVFLMDFFRPTHQPVHDP